jgi:hypothetical protein
LPATVKSFVLSLIAEVVMPLVRMRVSRKGCRWVWGRPQVRTIPSQCEGSFGELDALRLPFGRMGASPMSTPQFTGATTRYG